MYCDRAAWKSCHPEDMWIFDRLIMSTKLGYKCGPAGLDVPSPGHYIIRSTTDPLNTSFNAAKVWIQDTTNHLPPGHFWCEVFEGSHYRVDYINGEQTLCVEGHRDSSSPLYKWSAWKKTDKQIDMPLLCYGLCRSYPHIGCEFVGDKLIGIKLNLNPDFQEGSEHVIPVWIGDDIAPPEGMKLVERRGFRRKGLFVG